MKETVVINGQGEHTPCLVNQIAAPVCRRVVYWLPHDKPAEVAMGDRIGMIKPGSVPNIYLPANSFDAVVRRGRHGTGGRNDLARLKGVPR